MEGLAETNSAHRRPVDVSVIIPTFNRLWCLAEAVESCRGAACETEIIVVDDGSTDGTWEWLRSQRGLRIARQPNWGKPYAANLGFAMAKGEYVRFLDSDDLIPEGAIDGQLAAARSQSADIVVAGYTAWTPDLGRRETREWISCDDFVAQQLGECDSSHYSAYLFRRAFLSDVRHRPDYAFRDDRMFVIEAALKHPRVVSTREPGLIHRHHSRERLQFRPGLAAQVTNWQERSLFMRAAALLEARGELTERRAQAIAASLWPVARRIGFSDLEEAKELASWIRCLDPSFRVPKRDRIDRIYALLGFGLAQRLVNVARGGRNLWRTLSRPRARPFLPPASR